MRYLEDILDAINQRNQTRILQLWEEYCAGDQIDPVELKKILEVIKNSDFRNLFESQAERAICLWENLEESTTSHAIIRLIVDLQASNRASLKELVQDYLKNRFADLPNYDLKVRITGLQTDSSFQGIIGKFELLSHIDCGKFVFHTGGWGIGEIMDFSIVREQLVIEFDYVPGKKDLSFEVAFNTLLPMPDDHFLARRFGNPDQLEQEAKKDPVGVIRSLLRDLGPKTAGEIKDELCELVIQADDWSRWWQNTRGKLKRDTHIESPKSLKSPFKLREQEVSHEELLKKALEKHPDINTFIQMIYTFLRDFPETLKNAEFKQSLIAQLKEMLNVNEISKAQILQIYFFLEDLSEKSAKTQLAELVSLLNDDDVKDITDSIEVIAFKKRFLISIRKFCSEWQKYFSQLFLGIKHAPLRDYILTELKKAGSIELIEKPISQILEHPEKYPDTLIWYFQKITSDHQIPFSDTHSKSKFFEMLLICLSELEHADDQRDLTKKIHSLLTANRFSIVRKIFKDANVNEVKEFLLLSTKCFSFDQHEIKILQSLAEVAHPELAKGVQKENLFDEDIIWSTEKGFNQAKLRLEEIGSIEMIQTAKEIEIARSHGDLRENSEYKFALEKRDRLQGEMKFISDQIKRAQIISSDIIDTKKTGIGTIVECISSSGKKAHYTLLGPWDADPENNILYYQSKLAKKIEGLEVGESFNFQDDTFTITGIKSFL